MKSIKLASGFAVSALALAIAGQATAQEATTEVDFTGSVKTETVFDLENDAQFNAAPGYATGDEDWFNLTATWSITHGPLSGDIRVGIHEDTSAGNAGDNNGTVNVDNLRVDQGPVSFGQIGGVTDTADLLEEITDFDAMALAKETTLKFDTDLAARYTVAEFGLRVQAEGEAPQLEVLGNNTASDGLGGTYELEERGRNFGVAASIEQDLDVATIWFDAQYRDTVDHDDFPADHENDGSLNPNSYDGMDGGETTLGAAIQATPVDMVTLTGVVRNSSADDVTAFAFSADVTAADGIALDATYANVDGEDKKSAYKVGLTADFAPVVVEGSWSANMEEAAAGLLTAKATYTAGAIATFAELQYNLEDFGYAKTLPTTGGEAPAPTYLATEDAGYHLTLGSSYTYESGVVIGGEYEIGEKEFYDNDADVSKFTAFAEYSF